MSGARRGPAMAAALTLAAGVLTAAGTGSASASTASASCHVVASPAARSVNGRIDDDARVSKPRARAVQRRIQSPVTRVAAAALPTRITIPVRVHLLRGTHKRDKVITRQQAYRQVRAMNLAYAGLEQPAGATPVVPTANTTFRFHVAGFTTTRNDKWFHLAGPGKAANDMKTALHQGQQYTLNLYLVDMVREQGLLGYTTFPWQRAAHPKLDGVVIDINSMPGGNDTSYNQGDTAVHEVGHWLGLLHVFNDQAFGDSSYPDPADDCRDNDGLADTPVQAYPTRGCPASSDTCTEFPGDDSIHNFMDYSYDSCMYQFTPEQSARMDRIWATYRRL